MKILFIVRSLGYGGASKQLALTANALTNLGNDVVLYTYNWKDPEQELDKKIKYLPEQNVQRSSLLEYIHTPLNIRKVVCHESPDVIVAWRTNAGFMSMIASFGIKIPVVFCERTDPYLESNIQLKIAKFFCNKCDGGVFQTEQARDFYSNLKDKSIVIPNPIDIHKEIAELLPIHSRKKEIAFVGRFSIHQKRQDLMLHAFKKVLTTFPEYKLVFYGDGTGLSEMKKLASKLGIYDNVIFMGSVNGVEKYLSKSRLLVMTSDYEGIPNVIIEAFSCGVPVVTTDCSPGGARVLVDDNQNGFIVPRNDADALSFQICRVLSDEDLSVKFVNASFEKLKQFTPTKIFPLWNNYLNIMINK